MSDKDLCEFIKYMNWEDRFKGVTKRAEIIDYLADHMRGLYNLHINEDPACNYDIVS